MAKKKFYAVRKGKTPGIYETWAECSSQVQGVSSAEYKGFGTIEEAKAYLGVVEEKKSPLPENQAKGDAIIAYVDGSYNEDTKEFSYGMVILDAGKEEFFSEKVDNAELAEMRNVAGEIKGAEAAMRYAMDKCRAVVIYHDYEGIAKWCTGEWKAKKEGTKAYKDYFDSISDKIEISFVKVQGHSNDKYNDMADELAKNAIFKNGKASSVPVSVEVTKTKGNVYIERDIVKLNEMLLNEGKKIWESFEGKDVRTCGTHKRFEFLVDNKKAILDIYQRDDGTTTFRPTGINLEYSEVLKEAIEKCGMRNTSENKNFTIFLGEEWCDRVIEYLMQLSDVEVVDMSDGTKKVYQFTSKFGDKLTLSLLNDHKVWVQGKPLYLYNEFLSLISHAPKVTVDNLVELTNTFNDTDIKASDTKAKMSELLPKAYNDGKIEETIWKLFSPSVVLIEDEKEMDDYSCCVFPCLRSLEGYLKFLLSEKSILIDNNHTFGTVFKQEVVGDSNSRHILIAKHKNIIKNVQYEEALQDVYNYFKKNRHIIFHVDQVLIATKLIEDKQEAKDIFYEVVNLIETTYSKVESEL